MEKTNRLLSQIDAEHFLSVLGVEFDSPRGKEINFHCPFPGHSDGDRNPSAYMNVESTAWFCHGCHRKGTAVEFAMQHQEISRLKALQLLREKYDPGYFQRGATSTRDEVRRILTSKPQPEEQRQPVLPFDALTRFEVDWHTEAHSGGESPDYVKYMLDRGFTPDTLHEWEIGYDAHSNRITIPVRDERNQLIGIKGRAICGDQKPKYLVLGDRPGKKPYYGWSTYATGRVVFGLPNAIGTSDSHLEDASRHFIVCEGELNAIAVWQAGFAAVALNGSNLTTYQQDVIKREADRLTLWFDVDGAGLRAMSDALEEFGAHMPVNGISTPQDAADSTPEQIARLIDRAESGHKRMLSFGRGI